MAKKMKQADDRRLTNWMRGDALEPSGYADGEKMLNSEWLLFERAALARRGIRAVIVENPSAAGEFALARAR